MRYISLKAGILLVGLISLPLLANLDSHSRAMADKLPIMSFSNKQLNLGDLSPAAQQKIYSEQKRLYDALESAADDYIWDKKIEADAKKLGKTNEEAEELAFKDVKVEDHEAKKWWEENKHRLPMGKTLDELRKQIDHFLLNKKKYERRQQILSEIKVREGYTFNYPKPKPPVHKISVEGHPFKVSKVKGPDNSKPIDIVVYADYKCPHCRDASDLLDKVVESCPGVRLYFHDFPLQFSNNPTVKDQGATSTLLALGGVCAYEQGQEKFWEYHNAAFKAFTTTTTKSPEEIARKIHLDMKRFATCFVNPKTLEKVKLSRDNGIKLGIDGTPVAFVNGVKLDSITPENLQEAIPVCKLNG